jgi:hypothetical protein
MTKIKDTNLVNNISGAIHCPQCTTKFYVDDEKNMDDEDLTCPACGMFCGSVA